MECKYLPMILRAIFFFKEISFFYTFQSSTTHNEPIELIKEKILKNFQELIDRSKFSLSISVGT